MDKELYKCLEQLSKLGSPDWTTTDKATLVLADVKKRLPDVAGDEGGRVLATVMQLVACVDTCVRDDVRLECGCMAAALLHHILQLLVASEGAPPPPSRTSGRLGVDPAAPPPPPHLLSLQQIQVVAAAARLALYTVVLASLDQEAARYVRMSLARAKFVLGPVLLEVPEGSRHPLLGTVLLEVPEGSRHPLLAAIMKLLVPVVKHDKLGAGIRQAAFPEVLSALLSLCFCPARTKHHLEDTALFRDELDSLTLIVDRSVTLRHLLLLMGLAQGGSSSSRSSSSSSSSGGGGGGRGWLGRTCSSLMVRRYLMCDRGLQEVVGAGLALCDGQDVHRCQAVAALIAHTRIPDLGLLYTAVGPQVMAMLNTTSQLAPEVVRVVVLLAGELAERSPILAAHHLGQPLLHPLTLTTHPTAHHQCVGISLTECVARLYMVIVELAPPTPALARLLQPALSPLLAIAAMSISHLRSPARHLLGKYLSHLSEGEAVNTLVSLARLAPPTTSPPVCPGLALGLDEAGGVRVETQSSPPDALEEDEARASCLSAILEELGQPSVVLAFYKKLVEFLDFREEVKGGNGSGPPTVSLRTEADEVASQFERMRQVAMCVGLLSCLAESEKLTGELFQDLSAAGPVVDGLLRAGCQACQDEGLRDIQVSLTANVLVLVSCYVSDRSLRGEMTLADWAGLKALLPALNLTEECLEDEGVCLMATQLRQMVATHGVVQGDANTAGHTQGKAENKEKGKAGGKLDSATSRLCEESSGASPHLKENTGTGTSVCGIQDSAIHQPQGKDGFKVQVQHSDTETRDKVERETKKTCNRNMIKSEIEEGILKMKLENKEEGEENKGNMRTAMKVKDEGEKENRKVKEEEKVKATQKKVRTEVSVFKAAMDDLMSPMVPVRGHGILALARLVEERDEEALEHGTQLLALFQHHLREEDSYLYLMAVKGLAALCDVLPEKAVGPLTKEFSLGRRTTEDRAKLAESLSRAARRLGPLLPRYRSHFINAFLAGVRDPEWLVRAASLSALGDVCKELHFSLGPIVHEVFSVLNCAVAQDSSAEVRRAAVLVVTMLLQGLGGDALKVLRDILRDLYRTLRHLEAADPDPVVRLHSQLALQEVDGIMRRFLLPSGGLTKRIYVMDAPSPTL